ncbi:MAG TPA: alpha/beta hydrolase [Candidatus Saccharimonadia bacterium]|nr:alpha/beta hydrolase [Candidatus Saccharimonadia bacterium]
MTYPTLETLNPESLILSEDTNPGLSADQLIEAQYRDGGTRTIATKVYGDTGENTETVLWYLGMHERWERPFPGNVLRMFEQAGIRLIAIEPPGRFTGSDGAHSVADYAADAAAVMEAYDLERAHMGARSTGGAHALASRVLLGDRLQSLTLISSVVPLEEGTLSPYDALKGTTEDFKHSDTPLADRRNVVEPEMVRVLVGPREVDVNRVRSYLGMLSMPWNFEPGEGSAETPTVIIHGEEDTTFPYENARTLRGFMPRSVIQIESYMAHLGTMGEPTFDALRAAIDMSHGRRYFL